MPEDDFRRVTALRIEGPGADVLTIDASGNDLTPGFADGLGTSVFVIATPLSRPFSTVEMSGLTIRGGDTFDEGGGIRLEGSVLHGVGLAVRDTVIRDNHAFGRGGGIYKDSSLSLIDLDNVWLDGNSSERGGGAIFSRGWITVFDSTLSNNSAGGDGGAIDARQGVYMVSSTVSGNHARGRGGAVHGGGPGTLTFHHSTIVNNSADGTGDGLSVQVGTAINRITNSILANGSEMIFGSSTNNPLRNSILSSNLLTRIPSTNGGVDEFGNIIGSQAAPIDPLLGPLEMHGGIGPTHAPLAGSPAINLGDVNLIAGLPLRDLGRDPEVFGPTADPWIPQLSDSGILDQSRQPRFSGGRIDAGATEFQFPIIGMDLNGDGESNCHDINLVGASIREGRLDWVLSNEPNNRVMQCIRRFYILRSIKRNLCMQTVPEWNEFLP